MGYHQFVNEDGSKSGSFEVFALDGSINDDFQQDDGTPFEPGFYWWACFPGCMKLCCNSKANCARCCP